MKNFRYKLIAILLIALCIWPIIGGISVGDYDLLIGVLTCSAGYVL